MNTAQDFYWGADDHANHKDDKECLVGLAMTEIAELVDIFEEEAGIFDFPNETVHTYQLFDAEITHTLYHIRASAEGALLVICELNSKQYNKDGSCKWEAWLSYLADAPNSVNSIVVGTGLERTAGTQGDQKAFLDWWVIAKLNGKDEIIQQLHQSCELS